MMKLITPVWLLLSVNAIAATLSSGDIADDPTILEQLSQSNQLLAFEKAETRETSNAERPIELTDEQWRNNPQLLQQTYNQAALTKNVQALIYLQPIYESVYGQDDFLAKYARALIAHGERDFATAISIYRDLLVSAPEAQIVRVDLAMALNDNKQYVAAKDQLQRLRSEPLPESVAPIVDETLASIEQTHDWKFNVSAYYQMDDNINDAPKQKTYGYWVFADPKKAKGIHVDLGARKTFPLQNQWFGSLDLSAIGDYWDEKEYNDLRLRAGAGIGYQNARMKMEVQPYLTRRFYGNKSYSYSFGANLSQSYWLNHRIQLAGSVDISQERYDDREFLQGNRYFASLNGVYIASAKQYWLAGVNYYRNHAQANENAYDRYGVLLGWGQEWPHGISSRLVTTASKSNYDGPDIFNIVREDKAYQARISLWHRGVHWLGVTPKLTIQWRKTDSNHFMFDKDETTAFLEFSKSF